jgi:hypothetical protein
MAVDHIRYDILAQEALRGVVRTVLEDAAKNGLPGEHHFFIAVDTRHEGVTLSPRMREQYPTEITVVLQHQFWDLVVTADRFEVGLSFGGVAERLIVPFAAIKGFFDPSVQFGLQFEQVAEVPTLETLDNVQKEAAAPEKPANGKTARPPAEHNHKRPRPAAAVPPPPANPSPVPDPDKPASGGEVVRFDRFRKK